MKISYIYIYIYILKESIQLNIRHLRFLFSNLGDLIIQNLFIKREIIRYDLLFFNLYIFAYIYIYIYICILLIYIYI